MAVAVDKEPSRFVDHGKVIVFKEHREGVGKDPARRTVNGGGGEGVARLDPSCRRDHLPIQAKRPFLGGKIGLSGRGEKSSNAGCVPIQPIRIGPTRNAVCVRMAGFGHIKRGHGSPFSALGEPGV
jgi:hypothetical protein